MVSYPYRRENDNVFVRLTCLISLATVQKYRLPLCLPPIQVASNRTDLEDTKVVSTRPLDYFWLP